MPPRWSAFRDRAARAFVWARARRLRGRRLALLFSPLAVLLLVVVASRPKPVPQPVAFNHVKHTRDLGLGCEFCHQNVGAGTRAGLPNAETCAACHQVAQGTSAEAVRVTTLLTQGNPLRFNKLFRLADHVYFAHRRHVEIAKLDCTECHGGIAATERPPTHPLVRIKMNFCISCHQAKQQSVDCVACHR
ncbi:MAG: cytochrome c3 family protein [Gemmatimonadetes bacterium]|nr:cytochrome c3 family protein [Gemmatimonadota bacterium]